MSIYHLEHMKEAARYSFQPEVSVVGLTVTVAAGSFRLAGEDCVLAEDNSFTAKPHDSVEMYIEAFLVLDSKGAVRVLVDEVLQDKVDRYFKFEGSAYTLLAPIYDFLLPPQATTLDDIGIRVRRYVAPPPPPEPKIPGQE